MSRGARKTVEADEAQQRRPRGSAFEMTSYAAQVAANKPGRPKDKPARTVAVPATYVELSGPDLADVVDALIDAAGAARTLAERLDGESADQAAAKAARLERLIGMHTRALTTSVRQGK